MQPRITNEQEAVVAIINDEVIAQSRENYIQPVALLFSGFAQFDLLFMRLPTDLGDGDRSTHACGKFGGREWLGKIVVSSCVETFDLGFLTGARGQHDHGQVLCRWILSN